MSQFNSPTYDIQRPTGQCAVTGHPLKPGEPYIALLVEYDPAAEPSAPEAKSAATGLGMRRLDISLEAWNQGHRPERLFGFWRSTFPEPNQKKKLFVDNEVLMSLFRRLGDTDQPDRLAFRFVLGLILMRKRLLRYDGVVRKPSNVADAPPVEFWLVTPKGDDQPLEVVNPQLDDDKIQQVTTQLSEILEAEL